MTRHITPLLAALTLLAACGERTDSPSADSTSAGAPAVSPGTTTSSDGSSRPQGADPIDPTTGTLALTAEGGHAGSWTFQDVNGSVSEQTGGGQTTQILQLEAHNQPVHLRLRLLSPNGEITPGRYGVGGTTKGLDATYENDGVYYKSLGKATGAVELTRFADDRAVGSYDLTLESLAEGNAVTKVKGTFDMRVQR